MELIKVIEEWIPVDSRRARFASRFRNVIIKLLFHPSEYIHSSSRVFGLPVFRNSMRIIRISKLFKRKSNFRIFGGKIAIYCHYLVYFRGYLFAALQLASPTSRKRKENRENPGGMDGEDPRGRGWINHIPTFASKRQILAPLAPPSYPSPSLFPD